MKLHICENCGKEHDGSYGSGRFCSKSCKMSFCGKFGHAGKGAPKGKGQPSHRSPYGTWKCKCCNLIFETRKQLQEHNHINHPIPEGSSWSKGLTKENDERIAHRIKIFKDNIASGKTIPCWLGKHHTEETKTKLALKGGKREHSGRGKQGRYNGIWCDSSWELAWVIYNFEHGIKFKRYSGYFEYQFEGQIHKYYPDFELEDGTLIEIKGYKSKQWEAKLKQFPSDKTLLILGKTEIQKYIEYVQNKYGKNFVSLYETVKS